MLPPSSYLYQLRITASIALSLASCSLWALPASTPMEGMLLTQLPLAEGLELGVYGPRLAHADEPAIISILIRGDQSAPISFGLVLMAHQKGAVKTYLLEKDAAKDIGDDEYLKEALLPWASYMPSGLWSSDWNVQWQQLLLQWIISTSHWLQPERESVFRNLRDYDQIGVAFIEEYARERGLHTLIISPAQLRDRHWERRLDEANLPGQVVSYQELARDSQLTRNAPGSRKVLHVDKDTYRLVVVDEAHAFRNADTTWYEAMDRLMGGVTKDLILLTATPVNNSLWDLHSLFLLFGRHDSAFNVPPLRIRGLRRFFLEAGANDPEDISEARLFPLIDAVTVRRDRAFLEKHYPNDHFPDGTPVKFPKPLLVEERYDLDAAYPGIVREIVKCIDSLTMARYRPTAYLSRGAKEAADEEALAGLIRSGLLKRFESSWHAALRTVTYMADANGIVLEGLRVTGALPPLSTLRELVHQVQGGQAITDAVEEALEKSDESLSASDFIADFEKHIEADFSTLTEIKKRLEDLGEEEDPKLKRLRDLLENTPARKVAIFTSYGDTARYVQDAFEREPDMVSQREWTVVIGNDLDANAREHQLERFCPHSVTGDPAFVPSDGEVDLLLSTDVLSEGQNLQEAQAVISYDMPWNPQRVVQRNGRVIRLKSPHDVAYLYTLLPEQGDLELLLGLEARLRAKIAAANAAVGMETPVLASVASESKIYADLKQFTDRLSSGDETLLDPDGGFESGSFLGEARNLGVFDHCFPVG